MTEAEQAFRGWKIVALAFVAQGLAVGLTIIPYGLFIDPMVKEFGISVMTANIGLTLLTIIMTLVGPVLGPILDRRSIRLIMALGALLMSASFLIMSLATSLLVIGAVLSTGIAIGIAMLGPLACTTVIAKWFDLKRGQAVGIAAMGVPAGGFIVTPLAGVLLESFGWRTTLQCFAALVLAIVPFVWVIVRNQPADLGQYPDGRKPFSETHAVVTESHAWSTRTIVSARNFWVLAIAFGIVFGIGGGWNANFPKFAGDLGYGPQEASYLLALGALMGIPGTYLLGALADRMDNRLLTWVVVVLQTLCFMVLWTQPPMLLLGAAVAVFGMSGGGLLPVYASIIGKLFGPLNFGQVMGLAGIVAMPFGAIAPPLAGYLRDVGGSYALTLLIFCGTFIAAGIVLAALPAVGRKPAQS